VRPQLLSRLKRRLLGDQRHSVPPRSSLPPQPPLPYVLSDRGLSVLAAPGSGSASRGPLDPSPSDLREVHPGVWAGALFERGWCARVLQEALAYRAWSTRHGSTWAAPNSMHHRGIMLTDMGLEGLFDDWMRTGLQPLAEELFPDHLSGDLVECHAYIVEYSRMTQSHLGFHVDDSQITLNLCLGEDFEGSELYFEGPRCALHVDTPSRPDENFEWTHQPGQAVLHAGKNRHGVRPIQTGRRWSLIAWFRDGSGRARWDQDWEENHCPDWCGNLQRSRVG
jgi:hypothetical protein